MHALCCPLNRRQFDVHFITRQLIGTSSRKCYLFEQTNQTKVILVPCGTPFKMSLTSSSGCTKKFEIFSLADKNWMRSRNENCKALRIPFYFRPGWRQNRWRTLSVVRLQYSLCSTTRICSQKVHILCNKWITMHFSSIFW